MSATTHATTTPLNQSRPAWAKAPGSEGEQTLIEGVRILPWIHWDGLAVIDFERLSGDDLDADEARQIANVLLEAAADVDAINAEVR